MIAVCIQRLEGQMKIFEDYREIWPDQVREIIKAVVALQDALKSRGSEADAEQKTLPAYVCEQADKTRFLLEAYESHGRSTAVRYAQQRQAVERSLHKLLTAAKEVAESTPVLQSKRPRPSYLQVVRPDETKQARRNKI